MFPANTSSFRCRSEPFHFPAPVARDCETGTFLKVQAMTTLLASDLPLPRIGRGKVRDIYAVGEDRVLLLTTDRISAFDVVMAETIPMKGAVLTQISAWWFDQLEGVVPHHMISADADAIISEVPVLKDHRASLAGRAMLCRRTTVFPIECVIRGYLSGSAWKEYAAQQLWRARNWRPACSKAPSSTLRSSARRPRPKPVMTRTSRWRGCARLSAMRWPIRWRAWPVRSIRSARKSATARASSSPTPSSNLAGIAMGGSS